tara:strand:+ start:38 stop:655 length:618 start_codon:yes stop_codon:yes gene_type:complete
MPDNIKKGFKMEPKGAYMKMMGDRGIPKYGLPKNDTVDFNNPNVEKAYKNNPKFREHLKNKGVTYDPKTRTSKTVKKDFLAKMEEPMSKMHAMKKMEEPLRDMHLKKMEDDAMKAMKDPVAKMKEPMAAMKDPMAKMDPMQKYKDSMPKMMDPAKKMRTGSLMRKDYTLQNKATEAELQAAKQNAIDGGFDRAVAEDVFVKYEPK